MTPAVALAPGVRYAPGYLDPSAQTDLVAALRAALADSPLFTPRMPRTGKPFSVRMTNLGPLGWVSDESGYRYQAHHPATGRPWPPMPCALIQAWNDLTEYPRAPEAALVNWYGPEARMGLHQDRDEDDLDAPVVSLSLGDTALFRMGGLARRDATRSIRLASGDALVFGGPARLMFHGIDRLVPGSSTLLSAGGRINVTLRRVGRTAT